MILANAARRPAASVAFLCLTIALASSAGLPAQTQAPAAPAAPVAVDFIAVTGVGQPVTDLRVDQVTLKIDGKQRDIQLKLVSLDGAQPGTAGAAAAVLPPPYGSNELMDLANPSRTLIIVVDHETLETNKERPMREAVAQIIGALSPRDRIALVTIPHGSLLVDLTTDHNKVIQTLNAVAGKSTQGETAEQAGCRTRNTLQELTGMLDDLAGGEGPTTVLLFTASLLGPTVGVAMISTAAATNAMCKIEPEEFKKLGSAAETARANFYIVPPDTSPISPPSLEGIENIAGVTGGKRLALASASEIALSRIVRETSAYYVATFMPEPGERNGFNHRVEVKVTRDGVTTRTRPAIPIAKPGLAPSRSPTTAAKDMLKEARVYRALTLRVAGYASRNPGEQKLRIVALGEPVDPSVTLASAAMGLFDASGHMVAQWSALGGDLTPTPLQAAMLAPPGQYRLRFAATDTYGRSGTADYEMDGTLTPAGALQLSSIVLGVSRNGKFLGRMQFTSEASAIAELQIYGGKPGAQLTVVLEVAPSINGDALLQVPLAVDATSEPDKFIARGTIPVGALKSGDYVVRALVQVEGEPAGRVVRTIRKLVR